MAVVGTIPTAWLLLAAFDSPSPTYVIELAAANNRRQINLQVKHPVLVRSLACPMVLEV